MVRETGNAAAAAAPAGHHLHHDTEGEGGAPDVAEHGPSDGTEDHVWQRVRADAEGLEEV